jgi:anti-sigma factor RsiW
MDSQDHTPYCEGEWRERLLAAADGELDPAAAAEFEVHLVACPACRAEQTAHAALDTLLSRSRLEVRPDFRGQVMAALPVVGWEARHPRTWTFPAAVIFLLAGVATALLGSGAAPLDPSASSGWGALGAVAGLFRAAILAGSGLLAASWRGVGMVFDGALSPATFWAFALFVLCLNLLLISLLRRRRELPAARTTWNRHA